MLVLGRPMLAMFDANLQRRVTALILRSQNDHKDPSYGLFVISKPFSSKTLWFIHIKSHLGV